MGKRVVCFGAGKRLDHFMFLLPEIEIVGVIDNYKYGLKKNESIPIISLGEFLEKYTDDDVMVITSSYYEEIVKQLENCSKLENMDCYFDIYLENYSETFNIKLKSDSEEKHIPKKIHYCWFGKNTIPDEYQYYISSWKKFCPDYEIIQWDESNYDVKKNTYIEQAYSCKKWAFVSDYARVDILNSLGGIYFDTDVELLKNVDDLLKWDFWCGFESRRYVSFGLGFGSVSNSEILKDIKREYENMCFINENGEWNLTTCPIIQSRVLEKYGFIMDGTPQKINNCVVYPKEFFCPIGAHKGLGNITENSISIHHFSASWVENKKLMGDRFVRLGGSK